MKKVNRKNRINDLAVDVIEYAFTEWLVRQGAFVAFKTNYEATYPSRESFRDRLRLHIRAALSSPDLGPSHLISSAFPFILTLEGADFWYSLSRAWKSFCMKFRTFF